MKPNVEKARAELNKARAVIDIGETRALSIDGPVSHCREELTNKEFDAMWRHVELARRALAMPRRQKKARD